MHEGTSGDAGASLGCGQRPRSRPGWFQIRAFLLERGVATLRQGRLALARALPEVLEATDELSPMLRAPLVRLRAQCRAQDEAIAALDQQILSLARTHPGARLLMIIPGIGPLIATALVDATDDGQAFGRTGDLACWLGLVPRQYGTGGRPGCSASPNAATAISGASWCMPRVR